METFWDKKAREIDESWAETLTAHIPPVYKVVVLGHDDIRESGLIRQFCTAGTSGGWDLFERIFRRVISIDLQKCMIDLGEVESPNPDNAAEFGQWARSADGLFLLYDIASSPSFCWIQVLFELVRRFRESTFDDPVAFYNTIHTDMPSLPVSDLGHALPTVLVGVRTIPHGARQVFTTEAQELAKENGWGFVEVSAMDVNTIDEALLGIVQAIRVQKQSVGQLENFEGFEQQDLESDQVTVNNVEQEKQAIGKSVLTGLSQRTRTCVIL